MRLVCCLTYQPDHRRPDAHGAAGISRTGGRSLAGPAGRASDHEAGCDVSRQRSWLRQWRGGGVGAGVQQGVARFAPCAWNPADLGALVSELGLGRRPWIPSRSCESRPRWPILPFLCVCCRRWRAPNETPIESAAGEAASLGPLERLTIWPTACGEPLISFEMLSPDSDPPALMTVHRAQGSSFGEVFVAEDLFRVSDARLRQHVVARGGGPGPNRSVVRWSLRRRRRGLGP